MILSLRHNFSGAEYSLDIDEVAVSGNYYSFEIPFPANAPYGEYNYKLFAADAPTDLVSSGIINYSPYMQNKYVVRDNVLYVIYDAQN
jgi:hypothetical protein